MSSAGEDDIVYLTQDSRTCCRFCGNSGGVVTPFCGNCSEGSQYARNVVHKHCAEEHADQTGIVSCGQPCPAKYQIIYVDSRTGDALLRQGISTFAACAPRLSGGILRNFFVMKPTLLLLLCCICNAFFLYLASDYETHQTLSELCHMVASCAAAIALFILEPHTGSYILIFRRITSTRNHIALELLLLALVLGILLTTIRVFRGVTEVDVTFGVWIFFVNLLVLPCAILYSMWTRVKIFLEVPAVRMEFLRVTE